MVVYTILGLGMMGEAICYDLVNNATYTLINLIEIDSTRIENVKQKFGSVEGLKFHRLSIQDNEDELLKILKETDVTFGAIDYRFNERLTKLCITAKSHFLDLGGNPDVVKAQHDLSDTAKKQGICVIPDCGLAPGMVNVIASGLISQFDKVDECHIRVGGLPEVPEGILKYQQVFSIRGLTNEYIEDAIVLRDGKIETVPSLTELETLYFPEPFGELEAFQTAGGTSSLPDLYQGKIRELTYKTIRYPGHMQFFRFLLDFGFLNETRIENSTIRQITETQLVKHLPKFKPDVVLIRIFLIGEKDGNILSTTWELVDYADREHNISSMGRTTAFPISIIGQMLANRDIVLTGVHPGEQSVPFDKFVEELEKRQIVFTKQETDLT